MVPFGSENLYTNMGAQVVNNSVGLGGWGHTNPPMVDHGSDDDQFDDGPKANPPRGKQRKDAPADP